MSDQSSPYPEDTTTTTGLRFARVLVWLVYAYFVVAVIIMTLNFFLLLFNASADAEFTRWVDRSSDRLLEPFRGIFPSETSENGSVIDFAVLFAIIVYGILALVVHSFIDWLDRRISFERAKTRYITEQAQAQAQKEQAARAQAAQGRPDQTTQTTRTTETTQTSEPPPSA